MGIKQDGQLIDPCLEKLNEGEIFFVLRAQDLLAPSIVRTWAQQVASVRGHLDPKVLAAFERADQMDDWARTNGGKFPD